MKKEVSENDSESEPAPDVVPPSQERNQRKGFTGKQKIDEKGTFCCVIYSSIIFIFTNNRMPRYQ